MTDARWKVAPPGRNWGEFGPDDQLGRMNLVNRNKLRQGLAEVKEGVDFCLSLPLDYPGGQALNPRRRAPQRFATLRDGKSAGMQGFCWSYETEESNLIDVVCDDVLLTNTQYSTQWDSLAHMGSRFDADDGQAEAVFYNGFRAGSDIKAGVEDSSSGPVGLLSRSQRRATRHLLRIDHEPTCRSRLSSYHCGKRCAR